MKKNTRILIWICCILGAIFAGLVSGLVVSFAVDIYDLVTPNSFNVNKYGGLIFTTDNGTYCIKNDFTEMMSYTKEYDGDEFIEYKYIYSSKDNESKIVNKDDNVVFKFANLTKAMDKKGDFFDDSYIYNVNDLIFVIDNSANVFDGYSSMFYFKGEELEYVFRIKGESLLKIKIMEAFIK